MSNDFKDLVRDVVASPLGDVIASVGEGVAEAQQALDEGSLAKTLEIYSESSEETLRVLREIGYRPTFYVLPETVGEVRVSLKLGNIGQTGMSATRKATIQPQVGAQLARIGRNIGIKPRIYATPVDAGYANRYGYQANISAKLTFKIVPVPAPDGADELRIVPDLRGIAVSDATLLLEQVGLEAEVRDSDGNLVEEPEGTEKVKGQAPLPDVQKYTRLGELVILTIG